MLTRIFDRIIMCRLAIPAVFLMAMAVCGGAAAQNAVNTTQVTMPATAVDPNTANNSSTDSDAIVAPALTLDKSHNGDFRVGAPNQQFTLLVRNTGTAPTIGTITVQDTLPAGLSFVSGTGTGWTCSAAGQLVTCTSSNVIATGAAGSPVTLTVDVAANTAASVTNTARAGGGGDATCPAPPATTPTPAARCSDADPVTVVNASVTIAKSANPASGTAVPAGGTIGYTLTATVAGAPAADDVVFTDTLGAGLTVVASSLPAECTAAGQVVTCTVFGGTAVGTHAFNYSATVDASATASVTNTVAGGDGCTPAATCTTTHPVQSSAVSVTKTANPASGTQVVPGNAITYTLSVTVANSATTSDVVLTDTLSAGLTVGTLPAGCSAAGQQITCTLAQGAAPGAYPFSYQATVDAGARTSVSNAVVPSSNATCAPGACATNHPLPASAVTVAKSADPISGSQVAPGGTITYTLTAVVSGSATGGVVTLTDTLSAGLTVGALPAGCTAAGQVVTCSVAAGTVPGSYAFVYPATVAANATGSVHNAVVPSGTDNPQCASGGCTTTHPIIGSGLTVNKTANPASGNPVVVGQVINYTLRINVSDSATTGPVVLTDTLGPGLTVGALPPGCALAGQMVTCTLPAGTLPGTYPFNYPATVNGAATGSVGNSVVASGADNPSCTSCTTTHPVIASAVTVSKSSDPASGTQVAPGDSLTYTLSVTVNNTATTGAVVLTDTLSAGQTLGALPAGCTAAGQVVTCTLAAGAAPNTYTFVYPATVNADAAGSVGNSVVPSGPDNPSCTACTTTHPVIASVVTVSKSADPASGTNVDPGDTVTYTLSVTVAGSATTGAVVLTDTLSAGQTLGALPAGCSAAGQVVTCTLAAGAAPNTYSFVYPATVNADATGSVSNGVVPSGPDNPSCTSCTTTHPVRVPTTVVSKSSAPASGAEVRAGDVIAYTLSIAVTNAATTSPITLVDTLSAGQTLSQVPAGCTANAQVLTCVLAAGSAPGSYSFLYQATVDANAAGTVGNNVTASGGGGAGAQCGQCATSHPVAVPRVSVRKTSIPASGTEVKVGDSLQFTLSMQVENAAIAAPVVLTDMPGAGLSISNLSPGCAMSGARIVCTAPAGTTPGVYTYTYTGTVDPQASGSIGNTVSAQGGGDAVTPECVSCATEHKVLGDAPLKITLQASRRKVKIGDLIPYTLVIENVGNGSVDGATVLNLLPPGFSYVDGSLVVVDRDAAGGLAGTYPLTITGIDVVPGAGGRTTINYLVRVGAGVRPGEHVNRAFARGASGGVISNEASAQVQLASDPVLDESLILGTVFDDRDGDRWQDSAELSGIAVRGGFAPGAYVAGSTQVDRGDGPQAQADASAPLLHGIALGTLPGRQSEAQPADAHRIVVSQRLNSLDFTDDFVLTSDQGVTVRMDAAGSAKTERERGQAAKGLSAADPRVERRISQIASGYQVDYLVTNAGVDEHGIPGVRIASVEGLLVETDQFGRYHLLGVDGGKSERGRNFILKVDPATLPPGTVLTTDNPLLRRITPALPVRFDFGAKLPPGLIQGGQDQNETVIGEVLFDPGSARLREPYLPVVERIAEQARGHAGEEIVLTASANQQPLAYERAGAVRDALLERLTPDQARALRVSVRTDADDPASTLVSVGETPVLGVVLFDTDRSTIKAEYRALIAKIAADIDKLAGAGPIVVGVVGHADLRGSDDYNRALGLRRAKAVYEAIAAELNTDTRRRLRVEVSQDPTAPLDLRGK